MIAFKIITVLVVAAVLSLYLYDAGAHRVYDVIISGVVIIAASPIIAVLAIIGAIKNKKVFDSTGGLKFTAPDNALCKLPFFFLVFVGKRKIMPEKLIGNRQKVRNNSEE